MLFGAFIIYEQGLYILIRKERSYLRWNTPKIEVFDDIVHGKLPYGSERTRTAGAEMPSIQGRS